MPQMMPINWIISFFLFIMIFILFNIMNYYIYNMKKTDNYNKNNNNFFSSKKISLHWKW